MLAGEGHQALRQSDEADAQRSLVDDTLDSIGGLQFVGAYPQALHEQGELLREGRLLELVAVVKLFGCHLKHVVEFGKELVYALLLVVDIHALDSQADDVDGREREVAAADRGLRTETVLEDARAAAHRGHLVDIAFRVVGAPLAVLIERRVEVQEVGEEAAGRHLAGQLVEVEIAVFRQVVHTTLLLPYLDGEDSRLATADALVGREEYLAHDAAALGARVRTIINR